jgi:rubrerythrin
MYPDIASDWHSTKNGTVQPDQVNPGSNTKRHWLCKTCGYNWIAAVIKRTRERTGCPACAGRVVTSTNNLAVLFPELAAQWHPTKNKDVHSNQVTPGSSKKVWWLCMVCGYEWAAIIYSRTNGCGCPACAGHVATPINNFAVKFPKLAAQWHPIKNSDLRPEQITSVSGRKVWWLCLVCGHEWFAVVANRTNGRGCPACAGKVATPTRNLTALRPELVSQWHPAKNGTLLPEQFTSGSGKKVWWLCDVCGHEWSTTVASRTRLQSTGCPRCAGMHSSAREQQIIAELRDHAGWLIETGVKIHVPGRKTSCNCDSVIRPWRLVIEYDGRYWHSSHEALRKDTQKTNRLEAAGWTVIRIRENLNSITDNVVRIAQDIPDESITLIVAQIIDRAAELHYPVPVDTNAYLELAARKGPADNGYRPGTPPAGQSLTERRPDIAIQWHPTKNQNLKPHLIFAASSRKAWWLCQNCSHEWNAVIASRTNGSGCPLCARTQRSKIQAQPKPGQSLADLHPDVAAQWHPTKNGDLQPHQVNPGTNKKTSWWLCPDCGHEWPTSVNARTSHGTSCPACIGRVATPTNNLAAIHPDLAEQWHPTLNMDLHPDQITPSTHNKIWWLCKTCGCEWRATAYNRIRGTGCPACGNRKRSESLTTPKPGQSFLDTFPNVAAEWHPTRNETLGPNDVKPGSNIRVWWLCRLCKHCWQTKVNNRTSNGRGCPQCARRRSQSNSK